MEFDKKTLALLSVGASVAANCLPCLRYHSSHAREVGLSDDEIRAAAEVGRSVRTGAANHMDQLVVRLNEDPSTDKPVCASSGCNC